MEIVKTPIKRIVPVPMRMGSDPEFFFNKKTLLGRIGRVIGSEKVIPIKGDTGSEDCYFNTGGKIVRDGVQAEINPCAVTCRQSMGSDLARIMRRIQQIAKEKNLAMSWNTVVRISNAEMKTLSPDSKKFGCEPSMSAYDELIEMPDPAKYLYRSAGGHLHFGAYYPSDTNDLMSKIFKMDPKIVVMILDIIVGNTCVMVDRDEGNKERRKYYGRAGEYRLPIRENGLHGLEYRTPSNFWLRNYQMMSMVFGFARLAFGFALNKDASAELFAAVKEKDIRQAINENDFDLAKKNWKKIKPIIAKYAYGGASLCQDNLLDFEYFVAKGMDHFFKEDIIASWTGPHFSAGNGHGWESFMSAAVHTMRQNEKKTKS